MRCVSCIGACVAAMAATTSWASVVHLNPDPDLYTYGETRALARYRVSNTNWDQIVATSSSISASTIVQQANLGNSAQLNGTVWDFTLSYAAGIGYEWTLVKMSGNAPVSSSTVSWTSPHHGVDPDRPVNAIKFYTQAGAQMPAGIETARIGVSNLHFSAAGYSTIGALADMHDFFDDVGDPGDNWDPDLPLQVIVANGNLADTDWVFSGRVVAMYTLKDGFTSPGGTIDERLKLDIKVTEAVPAPGAAALLAFGMLGLFRRQR